MSSTPFAIAPLAVALALSLSAPMVAMAQSGGVSADAVADIALPAQPLSQTLTELARQTRTTLVVAPALLTGKVAPAVSGRMTVRQAYERVLGGSGLAASIDGSAVLVKELPANSSQADAPQTVTVTGLAGRQPGDKPGAYAGGQIARGGQVGVLGNRDVFETPFNVTNYTAQAIADLQATKVAELAKLDPSVQVVGSSMQYSEDFLVRGFRVTQSSIAFDGLSGISPNYGVGSLLAIDRVEVFKGANTLLNGVTTGLTDGGYINLVPKRATDTPVNQASLGFSGESSFEAHADIGRRFGEDKEFGARLNLARQDGDTAIDHAREKRSLAALSLDYRGDRVRLFADLGDQIQNTRGAPETLYPDAGIALPGAPSSGSNFAQSWNYSNTRAQYAHLKAEVDLTSNVTARMAYGAHQSRYEQVASYALLHDADGNIDEGFQQGRGRVRVHTLQGGIDTRFKTGGVAHQVSVSATETKSNYHFFYGSSASTGGVDAIVSNIYRPTRIASPTSLVFRDYDDIKPSSKERFASQAVADSMTLLDDRLLLTLGVRRQQIDTVRYDYDGLGTITGTYDKSATTPVVAALYKLSKQWAVYANYIESLDAGPTAPSNASNAGAVFPPSKSKQYEVGTKFDFGRIAMTADIFQITQPSGRLNPGTLIYAVDGEQRHRGVELNVFGQAASNVRVHGGITYLDATLEKTENGAADGKRAAGIGKLNLAGAAEWDFAPGWTVTGGVRHTGSSYVDQANVQRVPSFTIFDAGIRYKTAAWAKGVTIRAGVTNLADHAYFVADSFGGIFQGAPRTFNVKATVDF